MRRGASRKTGRGPKKRRTPAARWNRRASANRPRTVVVGVGRLGAVLAQKLSAAGWPVSVLPRSTESVRRAVRLNLKLAEHDALKEAQLCILCVPDAAIASLTASIIDDLGPDAVLLHCAGALDVSAFGNSPDIVRRLRGSFHPLAAISDERDSLAGHWVSLAASDRRLMPLLWRMALALRMSPLEVPEARRAAYHAGAVLSAGLLVALADAAVSACGQADIAPDIALAALLPLMDSALRGVKERGLKRGLTGPIARGDVSVVEAHLAALPAEIGQIYRLLSLRALRLAEDGLPQETRLALERLLR